MSSERIWRVWLEINEKIYSLVLEFENWKHSKAKTQKCSKEKRKIKNPYNKKHILENDQSWIGLGQCTGSLKDGRQVVPKMGARRSVMSSGLGNGCQVEVGWVLQGKSGGLDTWVHPGVIRGLSGGPDVYPSIDTVLRLIRTRM